MHAARPTMLVPLALAAQLVVLAVGQAAGQGDRDALPVGVLAVPRPADPVPYVGSASVPAQLDEVSDAGALDDATQGGELAAPIEPLAIEPLAIEPAAVPGVAVDCTPVEELGYRNGRRTPVTLVSIEGDRVERATANAYLAMREAAAKDGVELTIFSAFRSDEEQRYFYGCFKSCSCNSCAPAAKPGYSNHQMGRAIDIAMWPGVHEWLVAHAPAFGFAETVRGEPWHWELRGKAKPPAEPACPEPPRKRAGKTRRPR